MNTLPIDLIRVADDRQRKEHNPESHQELIESIKTQGLFNPLTLRRRDGDFWLVAGERRLRAIREIFELGGSFWHDSTVDEAGASERVVFTAEVPEIPFINLGECTDLEAEEAELAENIRREDLTWQERSVTEERLLVLRSKQAAAAKAPPVHLSTIAKEVRGEDTAAAVQSVTRNVLLARNLHRPEVKGAKTAAEAHKVLLRLVATERNAEAAAVLGKDFLGGKHSVYNADCLEWIADYQGEKFDVICMDPPYGMGADEFGDSGGGAAGAHFYEDSAELFNEVVIPAIRSLGALTRPDAHAYIFCDFDRFHAIKRALRETGWEVFRTPLIWIVPSKFRAPWPDKGPQRKYETVVYAVKGDLKVTKVAGDVMIYPMDENLGHQAQKPVGVFQDLLSRSVRPGMRVLDLFAGTGPVLPAGHALSAIVTAVEKDPAAYAIAVERVKKLKEGV